MGEIDDAPCGGGTSSAKEREVKAEAKDKTQARAKLTVCCRVLPLNLNLSLDLEFHFWRLSHSLFIRHGKVRLLFHMEEELGRKVRGEIADAFVVLRYFLCSACARRQCDSLSLRVDFGDHGSSGRLSD